MMMTDKLVYDSLNRQDGGYAQRNPPYRLLSATDFFYQHNYITMQWKDLGTAVALMFVMEGIMPFLDPAILRESLKTILEMEDNTLRMIGLSSMIIGVILLYLVH